MSQKIYIYKVLTKESRQDGRPNKYNDIYHPKAAYEIMRLGATKKKCAEILGITEETLYQWIREYPEFSESIKRGIDFYASSNVEKALGKRAVGFSYSEKTYEKMPLPSIIVEKGQRKDRIISTLRAVIDAEAPVLTKIVHKHYPPDVAAIKFFLSNREPERWPKNGDLPGEGQFLFYTQEDVLEMLRDEKKTLDRVPPPIKKEKQDDRKKGKGNNQTGSKRPEGKGRHSTKQ